MKRTRLGIMAALIGTGMLGTLSAAERHEPYALPASNGCDLSRGFATAALLAPASARPRKVSEGDAETLGAINGVGGSPFAPMRHGNLGAGSVMPQFTDLNGPQTTGNRGLAPGR